MDKKENIYVHGEPADMSKYQHMTDTEHCFETFDWNGLITMFENGETGYVYIGNEECPYCQNAVYILNEAGMEQGIPILYVNSAVRMSTEHEEEMAKYKLICDYMQEATVHGDIYAPTFMAVKDGKVVGYHISLVESAVIESEESHLTEDQENELLQIYTAVAKTMQE